MSEFQYYEFRTVDRQLTFQEIEEIRKLSSRTSVTSNRAIFTYSFGDFRGNSDDVLAKCFDAFLYVSNFSTKRLGFRLPTRLFKTQYLCPYEYEYVVEIEPYADHTIVTLHFDDDEGGGWIDEEDCSTLLDELLPLRQSLLLGDPRVLYITLLANQNRLEIEKYIQSLSIPPNLKNLTPALQAFVEFFELDPDLLKQVAAQSLDVAERSLDPSQLSDNEKNMFLQRLINNDSLLNIELQDFLVQKMMKQGTSAENSFLLLEI
jgi:hypothetical protein